MTDLKVLKRDGVNIEPFVLSKIAIAVDRARVSSCSPLQDSKEIAFEVLQRLIKSDIENVVLYSVIDKYVYDELMIRGDKATAKAYAGYRKFLDYKDRANTTDIDILSLIQGANIEISDENSNKNAKLISTQRDLIAGEVSKDIAKRRLLSEEVVQAHELGVIHYHDLDYAIQPMFNCCLINLKDMLDNGTIINNKYIKTPSSFRTACTITTQIIAQVSSGQYGGQSINGLDVILAPYLEKSYNMYCKLFDNNVDLVNKMVVKELKDGIQTIQYQINTLMTTNGQSPFITLLIGNFDEDDMFSSWICREILEQRIEGIPNEDGIYLTPAFPKLIYVLNENNIHPSASHYNLTVLAARCTARRMYPDYISAKKMKEIYEGNVFSPMGCRSFLSAWKDENEEYKFDGRFNMGVVSLNLPQIGIIASGDEKLFFKMLDTRLELCHKALTERINLLRGTKASVSPIHWQHGAIARLKPNETIDRFIDTGYATASLGYIGLYEVTKLMTGEPHTCIVGNKFAKKVVQIMADTVDKWKKESGIGFALYGTPAESLTYRFAKLDKELYGDIKDVTDKGYYTNSYHVDVREEIDVFSKFVIESPFQCKSLGGSISYVEIPNMEKNINALLTFITYLYDNVVYGEFNSKSDYCGECKFQGEAKLDQDNVWTCQRCGNQSRDSLHVVRRTCGYLGENFWNEGRTKEIGARVTHI